MKEGRVDIYKMLLLNGSPSTLDYLINVQDVIVMQVGNFPKINKCAGCNKAMQVGIFQKSVVKDLISEKNIPKIINVQDVIRPFRLEFLKKQ